MQSKLFADNSNLLCKNYRFGIVLSYLLYTAVAFHILFIPMFFWLGVKSLAYINIGSVILYGVAIVFVRKGRNETAFAVGSLEVLVHALLAVSILGWGSGFHYHILAVALLVLLNPVLKTTIKITVDAGICIAYIGLFFFSLQGESSSPLSSGILDILNGVNIIAFYFALTFLVFLYDRVATRAEDELQIVNAKLDNLAKTDPLTGLLNRRYMLELMEQEAARFRRSKKAFSIVMCDMDNFKSINDTQGHNCGDQVLIEVSNLMLAEIREQDRIARWGGEEFLLFLPETDLPEARLIAERICASIYKHRVDYEGLRFNITMTFGVSVYSTSQTVDYVISVADQALYKGKLEGKNRVISQGPAV